MTSIKNDVFNINGKVAVVMGGNGYLGIELCRILIGSGATVLSVDCTNINEELELISKEKSELAYYQGNILNDNERFDFSEYIKKNYPEVDILINCTTAKGEDFYAPFESSSLEGWNKGIDGNLTLPFLAIQLVIPAMKKRRSGSIINIASHYGMVGNDQRIYKGGNLGEVYLKSKKVDSDNSQDQIYSNGVYNASKAGLINLTRYLAAYYGEDNIRCNAISPGGIEHPEENQAFLRKYAEKVPLHRKGKRHELNGALIFLASDASSYITGHNLVVDGGYTAW